MKAYEYHYNSRKGTEKLKEEAKYKTITQLANELGVSRNTIQSILHDKDVSKKTAQILIAWCYLGPNIK